MAQPRGVIQPRRVGLLLAVTVLWASPAGRANDAAVHVAGPDFEGGAKDLFGEIHHGERVNYVYAEPTGPQAHMRAVFTLESIPAVPVYLHIKARDDNGNAVCAIAIRVNGTRVFEGPNRFPADGWGIRRFPLSRELLKAGANEIEIANREPEGQLGMPPWFMVAWCAVAPETYVRQPDITRDFFVVLPEEMRPLPEPLPDGEEPGFAIRGIKGWMWRPDQYLEEIAILAAYRMNFLMNCYGSMCDVENVPWGNPQCNRWWEPLPEWKRKGYEEVVRSCREHGIQFCFSMNPNISTARIVDYDSPEDVAILWGHYSWMQGLGVKWFNISLDDISEGIDASGQARVVNEIFRRLRGRDPEASMILCPTYYWGDGTGAQQRPYLETLARELDPDIYLFWTGDSVVGQVTRRAAESFKSIARHRVILWDNYPVNDNHPTMHLAPLTGRDRDLDEVLDGYMSNSMCTQNQANRIPLLTCADYAYNPRAYDPSRSIGQSILHLADAPAEREALRDLVEAYAGMLLYRKGPNFNAVRDRYVRLSAIPHSGFALRAYTERLQGLSRRMERLFPEDYRAAKKTLADDVAWVLEAVAERYAPAAVEPAGTEEATMPRRVDITRDGKTTWRVYVPPGAGPTERFAAEQLKRYVKRMAGAELEDTDRHDQSNVILVGPRKSLQSIGPLPAAAPGYDGYAVRVSDGSIAIAGDNARGVVYGVYDFLERLGCRWFYPAQDPADPEVVPRRETVSLPPGAWSIASPMRYRICNGSAWFFDMDLDAAGKQLDWAMKNRFNAMGWQSESKTALEFQYERMRAAGLLDELEERGMFLHGPGHSFDRFLDSDALMDEHPEWFGMRDGVRVPQTFLGAQFCWSNAEARQQFAHNVESFVMASPHIRILYIVPFDGGKACACPECRKAGASNLLMQLMGEVIERLGKSAPRVLVETVGGYEPVTEPPGDADIHPKQRILWAHWGRYHGIGYDDEGYDRKANLERWLEAAPAGMTVCQYYTDNFAEPWVLPPFAVAAESDRRYFLRRGIDSVYLLMWPREYWWNHGLNGYLAGRCFYDASADPFVLIRDFAVHYFGERAGPLLGAYYEEWARNVDLAYNLRGKLPAEQRAMVTAQRREWIDPAVEAVKDNPVLLCRVGKVERLHSLVERIAELHRCREEIEALRESGRFDEAESRLGEARDRADGVLEFFCSLAELEQGLVECEQSPSFITRAVKGWIDEETATIPEARSEAQMESVEPAFVNPIYEGKDPWVVRHGDDYYLCQSEGDRSIAIWKSGELTDPGIKRVVWTAPERGWNAHQVWAPELHHLRGRWYVYYCASEAPGGRHQVGVLEAATDDPQGSYEDKGMLFTGDDIAERRSNRWAIDPTVLETGDRPYLIWSGLPPGDDAQYLYIAPMEDPWTVSGKRVKICENDTYRWERLGENPDARGLNEGPEILKRGHRIFLVYSCTGASDPWYKMGLLFMDADADPLDPANWTKRDRSVFQGTDRVFGPGHASFVKSPDGTEDWIVYHSKASPQPGWERIVSIQPFRWTEDGFPDFGEPVPPGKTLRAPSGERPNQPGGEFADSFDDNTWDRWLYHGFERYIRAENGMLSLGGDPARQPGTYFRTGEKALVRGYEWGDVSVETRVRIEHGDRDAGILFRVRRPSLGYDAQRGYFAGIIPRTRKVVLGKTDGKKWTELALVDHSILTGEWYTLRVEAGGERIQVFVDGALRIEVKDTAYSRGMVGARVVDTHAWFDDFRVRAR